jgi:hypothetical protein
LTRSAQVVRPHKTMAAGFDWSDSELASGRPQALLDALTVLGEPPPGGVSALALAMSGNGDYPNALARARAYIRDMLVPVARALGIAEDDPLLVENVAFRLAADRRLWSAPAPRAGRPKGNQVNRAELAEKVAEFVDGVQTQRKDRGQVPLSNKACIKLSEFGRQFEGMSVSKAIKLLAEARGTKASRE